MARIAHTTGLACVATYGNTEQNINAMPTKSSKVRACDPSRMFEAIQFCLELKAQTLLKYILEALSLKAKKETKYSQDESKVGTEERMDKDEGGEGVC